MTNHNHGKCTSITRTLTNYGNLPTHLNPSYYNYVVPVAQVGCSKRSCYCRRHGGECKPPPCIIPHQIRVFRAKSSLLTLVGQKRLAGLGVHGEEDVEAKHRQPCEPNSQRRMNDMAGTQRHYIGNHRGDEKGGTSNPNHTDDHVGAPSFCADDGAHVRQ